MTEERRQTIRAEKITVWFTDGTKQDYRRQARPGGSWCLNITFSDGWIVIADEWDKLVTFPDSRISSVDVEPAR